MGALQIVTYVLGAIFIIAFLSKGAKYARMPIHLRWELYPLAGEAKRPWGGSYLEDSNWWTKAREEKSFAGEMTFLGKEVLFFKEYFHRNRSFWYIVYPFHIGIFLLVGFFALLLVDALTMVGGIAVSAESSNAWGLLIHYVTLIVGVAGLIFGAIIPKNDYLNISLLGKDLTSDAINDFIITQDLHQDLEYDERSSLCGCNPLIAISPAHSYYGDRWVAVGDTAVTRLYKDGIGSAFYSAQSAMQIALKIGISKGVFQKHYAPYCQRISWDNRYGNLLYRMLKITLNTPRLLKAWIRTLQAELAAPREKQIHIRVVWGMFTGDEPYRVLFRLGLQPQAIRQLLFHQKRSKENI